MDAGYVDAEHLLASRRDHGVRLIGPTPKDQQWQARTPGAFTLQDFRLDWDRQIATCPAGHPSQSWSADQGRGRMVIRARFSRTDCHVCALKPRCTHSTRRLLTLRPREEHAALEAARAHETQEVFAAEYRQRAGIEGTLSQGVRVMALRRARYIGLAKVHLQHVLTAAAPQSRPSRRLADRQSACSHAPVNLHPAHGAPSLNSPNSPAASLERIEP